MEKRGWAEREGDRGRKRDSEKGGRTEGGEEKAWKG